MKNIPVILITYNRPWHAAQVLEKLKLHDVQNLYIFSDAPIDGHDNKGVSETRHLIEQIRWTIPEVIYQRENIGLARSIVTAVNFVFERYDKIILLEDDCVPQQYFFSYMAECLKRYEDNDKIFGVSGYTIPIPENILVRYPYDNYFSPRISSWGWATWKRAWEHHANDLSKLYALALERGIDLGQGGSDIPDYVESMLQGKLTDVWTLSWQLTVYLHGGCYIHPIRSHIDNIGMDGSGVHCTTTNKFVNTAGQIKRAKFADKIFYDKRILNAYKNFYDIPETGNKFHLAIHRLRSIFRNIAANYL